MQKLPLVSPSTISTFCAWFLYWFLSAGCRLIREPAFVCYVATPIQAPTKGPCPEPLPYGLVCCLSCLHMHVRPLQKVFVQSAYHMGWCVAFPVFTCMSDISRQLRNTARIIIHAYCDVVKYQKKIKNPGKSATGIKPLSGILENYTLTKMHAQSLMLHFLF